MPPSLPQASNRTSSIIAVGGFTATLLNLSANLTLLNASIPIKGIKLDETFIATAQMIETSKRVPFIDGSTGALVNAVTAGQITFRCARVGTTVQSGDLPLMAAYIQKIGDQLGSTITISYTMNGILETWTFYGCTLVSVPPLILAGNDIPIYDVVFSYDDYSKSP